MIGDSYQEQIDELFIINDTALSVIPSDISLFSDSDLINASFLRSEATFTYTSKYAREIVSLTIPISLNNTNSLNDNNAILSQREGLKVLTQLSNYPFCFIKSPRLASYIAPTNTLNPQQYMLFAVEEVTVTQVMTVPDILFATYTLVYFNTAPLLKSYKFKDTEGQLWDHPAQSNIFVNTFSNFNNNEQKVLKTLEELRTLIQTEDPNTAYLDESSIYGTTALLAPIIWEDDLIDDEIRNLKIPEKDLKHITVTSAKGNGNISVQMLTGVASKDSEVKRDLDHLTIGWVALADLTFANETAIQSIRITKRNKIARQYIMGHKHPILQFMGKDRSDIEIKFAINSENEYKSPETSVTSVYSQITNLINYNAATYPSASAYNYLKLKSLAASAIGVENIVLQQKSISASIEEQGVEQVVMAFVETNTEEFLQLGKVNPGRKLNSFYKDTRDQVVLSYLTNYIHPIPSEIEDAIIRVNDALATEFTRGFSASQFVDALQSKTIVWYKNFAIRYGYHKIYVDNDKQEASKILKGITVEVAARGVLSNSTQVVQIDNPNNFVKNGVVDTYMDVAYQLIRAEALKGDTAAQSAMALSKGNLETNAINDAYLEQQYTNPCYDDIRIQEVKDSIFGSAFPYLHVENLVTTSQISDCYQLVNEGYKDSVDKILANYTDLTEASVRDVDTLSPQLSILRDTSNGVLKEYIYKETGSGAYYTNVNGEQVTPDTAIDPNFTPSAQQTTFIGNLEKGVIDWNDESKLNSSQLKVKQLIKEVVAESTVVAESSKPDWELFMIQAIGIESALGKLRGNKGVAQWTHDYKNTPLSVLISNDKIALQCSLNYFVELQRELRKFKKIHSWADLYLCYQQGSSGYKTITEVLEGKTSNFSLPQIRSNIDNQGLNTKLLSNKLAAEVLVKTMNVRFAPLNKRIAQLKGQGQVSPAVKPIVKQSNSKETLVKVNVLKVIDENTIEVLYKKLKYTINLITPAGIKIPADRSINVLQREIKTSAIYIQEPTTNPSNSFAYTLNKKVILPAIPNAKAEVKSKDVVTAVAKSEANIKPPSSTTNNYIPFRSGIGRLTGSWGSFRKPNGITKAHYHAGIDAVPTNGDPTIVAAADGVVTEAGYRGSAGNVVVIWHDRIGFSTNYMHLASIATRVGSRVTAGSVIGVMGNTGGTKQKAYATHLHYGVSLGFVTGSARGSINPFKTTQLNQIPLLSNPTPIELNSHAKKYLSKDYLVTKDGTDLSKTLAAPFNSRAGMVYSEAQNLANPSQANVSSNSSAKPFKSTLGEPVARPINTQSSVFNEDLILTKQFINMAYPFTTNIATSIPVVKVYISVGSDNESIFLQNILPLGYYFEVKGLSSVSIVCNNDDNPVDLLRMAVANPSFIMTDNYSVTGKYLTTDYKALFSEDEARWVSDRIKLQPGLKLHVRMGYSNNPNELVTVFNGIITEMTQEKTLILDVVCEGLGRELLSTQLGAGKKETAGGEWHSSSTGVVISKALLQEGIADFGTNTNLLQFIRSIIPFMSTDDKTDPEAKRLVTLAGPTGVDFDKGNICQRLFSNIYAAEVEVLHSNFANSWGNYLGNLISLTEKSGYFYVLEGQTPWDMIKEMEYRHPGTLSKPLLYDDRMTMFFGFKEQLYIARDLNPAYQAVSAQESSDDKISEDYLKQRWKRMELVTRIHVATSSTNIISNGLTLNSDYATGVNVVYFEDDDVREYQKLDSMKEFKATVDDDLNYWEYRYKVINMPGTHGKYSAFMYATTALRREAETMYGGRILLTGNPNIKANDYIFIDDTITHMYGLIKVRECMHTFNDTLGFITEITPGLYIEASNFMYSTLFLRLSATAQLITASVDASTLANGYGNTDLLMYYRALLAGGSITNSTNLSLVMNRSLTFNGSLQVAAGGIIQSAIFIAVSSKAIKGSIGIIRALNATAAASKVGSLASRLGSSIRLFKYFKNIKTFSNIFTAFRFVAGTVALAGGAVFGAAAVVAGLAIGAVSLFAYSYIKAVVQEQQLTRQPLMFFPINYLGKPYTAGLSGYKFNSWWDSKKNNIKKNVDYVGRVGQAIGLEKGHTSFSRFLTTLSSDDSTIVSQLNTGPSVGGH